MPIKFSKISLDNMGNLCFKEKKLKQSHAEFYRQKSLNSLTDKEKKERRRRCSKTNKKKDREAKKACYIKHYDSLKTELRIVILKKDIVDLKKLLENHKTSLLSQNNKNYSKGEIKVIEEKISIFEELLDVYKC